MRLAIVIVFGACSGKAAPVPTKVQKGSGDPAKAAVEDCTSVGLGWKPGNVDRYSFKDDATGKLGFKDKAGNVVIAPTFKYGYEFSPYGVAGVVVDIDAKHGSPFGFIDPSGKLLARAFAFDNGPDYWQEGMARIVNDAKLVGYITDRGTITIAPKYLAAAAFCHGKAEVELDDTTFFIDKQGNKTTPPVPDTEPVP
jgi:WG containing repeat